ncbi:hypothetical protein LWI28_004406 [Acer negundo]|nr:hypothetical protein LWI28_004406 [Acer negundo]
MSWQTYVDEHLMCETEGQHLTAAAIIGHDGSVWAQSASFPQFKPEEIAAIMKDFDEPGSLAPTGLHLAGAKYMVIQGEPGAVIRGKKGPGGVTVKKTTQALIFGIYDEPMTPGQCNMVVERLGDYLVDQGLDHVSATHQKRTLKVLSREVTVIYMSVKVMSIEDLAKNETPYRKKMMKSNCKSYGGGLDAYKSYNLLPKATIAKKQVSRASSTSFSSFPAGSRSKSTF